MAKFCAIEPIYCHWQFDCLNLRFCHVIGRSAPIVDVFFYVWIDLVAVDQELLRRFLIGPAVRALPLLLAAVSLFVGAGLC